MRRPSRRRRRTGGEGARARGHGRGQRRLRRKRRKRERARKLEGVERGAGASARASAKKLLAESDELEAALRGWLRDAPAPNPSDDVFVENPFHYKPGFGGSDALRCICQNPDEPFWPDGHADDDDDGGLRCTRGAIRRARARPEHVPANVGLKGQVGFGAAAKKAPGKVIVVEAHRVYMRHSCRRASASSSRIPR